MTMAENKYGGLCTPHHDAAIGPRLVLAVLVLYGDLWRCTYNQNSHTTFF
jgi:hypothetical protein